MKVEKKFEELQNMKDLKITAGEKGWYVEKKHGEKYVVATLYPVDMPKEGLGLSVFILPQYNNKTFLVGVGELSASGSPKSDANEAVASCYEKAKSHAENELSRREYVEMSIKNISRAAEEYELEK